VGVGHDLLEGDVVETGDVFFLGAGQAFFEADDGGITGLEVEAVGCGLGEDAGDAFGAVILQEQDDDVLLLRGEGVERAATTEIFLEIVTDTQGGGVEMFADVEGFFSGRRW